VFESENTLHAIEIKSVKTPSSKDITNLREFARQSEKEVKCYLFYLGEEYSEIDGIHLIPVYSLFCGK
jgi:hypothetical protein